MFSNASLRSKPAKSAKRKVLLDGELIAISILRWTEEIQNYSLEPRSPALVTY